MTKLPTVRASSLSGWADCPRRAAARMFRREIEAAGFTLHDTPRGIGASIGTAVHKAAALTLTEKAKTGNLAPLSAVTDCAVESLRGDRADGETLFDRESPDAGAAEKQVVRMSRSYRDDIAPQIEPTLIEERLEADTGLGLILSGQSDVIAREKAAVRDLKTGKRLGYHKPQCGAYSMLARTHGNDIDEAVIDHVPRVPLRTEQPAPVQVRYDVAEAESAAANVLRHIADDLRVWREGDPERRLLPGDPSAFLANPSSILCSSKWCPAHGSRFCTEHRKETD